MNDGRDQEIMQLRAQEKGIMTKLWNIHECERWSDSIRYEKDKMNRRSFINKIVQGGAVVATGLPEKLLSSEASAVAVDTEGIKLIMEATGNVGMAPNPIKYNFEITTPAYPEDNYVYVGEPVAPDVEMDYRWPLSSSSERFVHKKYFLVALLKDKKN